MKKLILVVLVLFYGSSTFSQEVNPPLGMRNGFFGWQFHRGEEKLKPAEVAELMKSHEEAARLFSKGRSGYTMATVLGSIGGGMLGYTLGTSLGGGDANWTIGGIGAGLVVVALPLSISATNKVKKALVLYNEKQRTTAMPHYEWKLMFGGNQMTLVCQF